MKSAAFLARKAELTRERQKLREPQRPRRRVLGTTLDELVVSEAPRDMVCESVVRGEGCSRLATRTGKRGKALCGFCYEVHDTGTDTA